jgi:orotate phosphoribosyltransferase
MIGKMKELNMGYKRNFVKFLLTSEALEFGDFTLKSGRKSPYMINTGRFDSGDSLSKLGCFYAKAIYEKMELGVIPKDISVIFGSAYKGIPLAAAASMAMSAAFDLDIGYCFNRKEAKDHGEGGLLVGRAPKPGGHVLVIDDVMTAGTALRETAAILAAQAPEAIIAGSVIAVDRMERGTGQLSAVAQTQYEMGFPVFSIVDMEETIAELKEIRGETETISLPTQEQIAAIERHLLTYSG